ncbi:MULTISPECIES: YbdD/YjiX family protein [unclassified Rhodococcus (in: high G+C Gram-positive bacteria)]|jgi:uncharacterized short protein YbdD (DUF466 family)|uniref:YbdD/YjiX family protein n=1 Tax=unclassified Rhodococcus (in: high G+C Gram-positive bacteria) TaxID=192944 RepID=UPI00068C6138|nr:hypothetical protein ASG69_14400 [Rhodococcus sp. Leaf225]KQU43991.1 hypothetical protein ASH03_16075 [Rhodococcus sp. Leaf258]MDQ1181042.1 uncharacterized short protein YbdD (DUF466 family) [Rhodococcus sp. SORGH_AS_0301]MDQ1202370.1 uncharacterized short protein YbdD (DUF466 family) [Rhodococcus sp. SORGH_AS_0303]
MNAVLKSVRAATWWITSVMGDHDYERFVEHRNRVHPGHPVPSEREYWKARHAEADANPGARCC